MMLSIPLPLKAKTLPYHQQLLADGSVRQLDIVTDAPNGVIIINNYLEAEICEELRDYADQRAFHQLEVIDTDPEKNTLTNMKSQDRITDQVSIDGISCSMINIFNDIYCNRLSPFFNCDIEAYERPHILRYSAGGLYRAHADSENWDAATNSWNRVINRDLSVLLYLNDDYEGGELEFPNQQYKFKPKAGMMVGFPSDHRYLHAAHPTLSGIRYAVVSWGTIPGSKRIQETLPKATINLNQTIGL